LFFSVIQKQKLEIIYSLLPSFTTSRKLFKGVTK